MRAVVVTQQGGSDAMQVQDRPEPQPGPHEVRVDVGASGVNFIDTYQRSGAYPMETPFVAGSEGAGTVSAVGAEVDDVRVGDRVAWLMVAGGGYAEQVLVPAERCVPVPDDVDDRTAAAAMLQGVTADYLTHSTYVVRPGDDVLVHAAAGGMGLLLTQICTFLGARVIGTTSTPAKAEAARAAGAAHVVDYTSQDVADEVRRLTDGRGVAVAYDGVGRTTQDASLDSLARRGVYVLYGQASGPVPPVEAKRLNAGGSLFFTRPTVVDHVVTREELLERTGRVLGWVRDGSLRLTIGGTYALDDAARAHDDLEGRRTTGKLLVLPHG
ncbi:MAG: quinone oxidoreductase [Nocardioidaceae bacterium]|nr:quinone oxidoreductase [Nocardioidaceae bacterium]